jgi:hypothetical protein
MFSVFDPQIVRDYPLDALAEAWMAYDEATGQFESYKVGTRLRVRTGVAKDSPLLKGVIIKIEPPGTRGGSLELYTIELDKPSYRRFEDTHTRPGKNPKIWRTDSSMCGPIPVLDDLSELWILSPTNIRGQKALVLSGWPTSTGPSLSSGDTTRLMEE